MHLGLHDNPRFSPPAPTSAPMIDLYYWTTPNGHKITMFLEEAKMKYRVIPVNIGKGEQFDPAFLKVSPNNRIPAIVDHKASAAGAETGTRQAGAARRALHAVRERRDPALSRRQVRRIPRPQVALLAQGGHPVAVLADGRAGGRWPGRTITLGLTRPRNCRTQSIAMSTTARLYAVMDKRLADREYLAGEYSIADMACYPWVVPHERQQMNLDDFPNLKRWFEVIKARPATIRAYQIAKA